MRKAIQMSGIKPKDIDQINVHATSTEAGDEIEARSIQQLLGEHAQKPTITAFKSYFGHTFAAAGAI
jgi:3-oxoacyl-[acyl-carrier-protein] synthase II